ncbi:MAG: amino acid adenylation domain-containing protein [Acidimicrobiia bacterium]|nr:amino acid adenylation domain-containing protein [Acidimicrobiia bacterium]
MSEAARRSAIDALIAERLGRSTPVRHVDSSVAPLTHVQQSLWLTSHLEEGANNRPLLLRLSGNLDSAALSGAIDSVVCRHPVLVSTFPLQGAEPVQLSGNRRPAMEIRDVSGEKDPLAAARSLADDHTSRSFDLENEVPFIPLLIRVSPNEHLLAFAMHHIVFDGWSEPLFVDELIAHYDAALEGSVPAGLPDLKIDYADHARWERATTTEDSFEKQLQYWRRQLADLPPDLKLPLDREMDPDSVANPVHVQIPPGVMSGLEDLARGHGATLFMVLLAALQVLIARHAGVDDVVVGVPTPGRPRSETENLIGCFINLVPIRTSLQDNPRFSEVIENTRRTTLEALDNSSVPYGQVFGAVRPWSTDRIPLHRVHFQMRDFHQAIRQSTHLEVEVVEPRVGATNHLTVRATRAPTGAAITFGYHPGRFRRSTIERWSEHYVRLLESVAGTADPTILDIELMGEAERRTTLEEFNPDEAAYLPSPPLASECLRSAATQWPDFVAMEEGTRHVTYAEFDRMVDSIAWSLMDRNLGPEDVVILSADRGIDAAAAMFGALRTGVAYVPIDSELTSEWMNTVIEQTKPALVLTTLEPWTRDDGLEVRGISQLLDDKARPFPGRPKPEDLAYVLYTSGSTGPPKGVMVEQGNVAWFLKQTADFEPLSPGDRIVWFHSLSFDAHMNSLHAAFAGGATVVVRDEASFYSIPRLVDWLTVHRISHLRVSAGFFHVLVEELAATGSKLPDTLRLVAFGGEQVRADIVNLWHALTGGSVQTVDSYGPTEATVWVTANDLTQPPPTEHEWISIGPPRAPSRVHVIDGLGNLAPIGIHGELYISGPLVARGYLNAPELTAERFSPDPFSRLAGTRMYRSGDIGRWLPNGTLEVIGRVDRQVKIRGFRVEPAEVETALRKVAGIDAAVVLATEAPNGDMELRGFVTFTDHQPIDLQAVRRSLGVPKFMVPTSLTAVSEIPMTISGKVDKNALLRGSLEPAATILAPRDRADIVAPTSTVPDRGEVARIWCEVLGADDVDATDDFFNLGGHSLLAIKVISRIKARLGVSVELTDLFEYPTFGAFSDMVLATARADIPSGSVVSPPIVRTSEQHADSMAGFDPDMDGFLTALEQMTDEEAEEMLRRLDAGGR